MQALHAVHQNRGEEPSRPAPAPPRRNSRQAVAVSGRPGRGAPRPGAVRHGPRASRYGSATVPAQAGALSMPVSLTGAIPAGDGRRKAGAANNGVGAGATGSRVPAAAVGLGRRRPPATIQHGEADPQAPTRDHAPAGAFHRAQALGWTRPPRGSGAASDRQSARASTTSGSRVRAAGCSSGAGTSANSGIAAARAPATASGPPFHRDSGSGRARRRAPQGFQRFAQDRVNGYERDRRRIGPPADNAGQEPAACRQMHLSAQRREAHREAGHLLGSQFRLGDRSQRLGRAAPHIACDAPSCKTHRPGGSGTDRFPARKISTPIATLPEW